MEYGMNVVVDSLVFLCCHFDASFSTIARNDSDEAICSKTLGLSRSDKSGLAMTNNL